jgi:hypothetical protein
MQLPIPFPRAVKPKLSSGITLGENETQSYRRLLGMAAPPLRHN